MHDHTYIPSAWLTECDTVWVSHFCSHCALSHSLLAYSSCYLIFVALFFTCPRSLITLSPYSPLLSSHLSLLCHIIHPVRRSRPISPSLTPNLSLLLSSLHPIAPSALSLTPSSIFLPFWLSSPFLFHHISSLVQQSVWLAERLWVAVTHKMRTHMLSHTHTQRNAHVSTHTHLFWCCLSSCQSHLP